MIAVVLGVMVRLIIGAPAKTRPGIQLAQKGLLRLAIILLGVQLTFAEIAAVGGPVLIVITATVVFTFGFTQLLGRWFGIDEPLTHLIAAGSSICGISAIVATNSVVKTSDEDVAYAVATATALGSVSIFLYPVIADALSLQSSLYAVWAGSSLHEVAQVIAASFIQGEEVGEFAVVVKLTRVLMLAPMVLALGWALGVAKRRASGANYSTAELLRELPLPLFVFGFVAMAAINSTGVVPGDVRSAMTLISIFLFAMALAALGLETDLRKLRDKGPGPLLLAALAWVFVSAFSLAAVYLL
jgi:uncharacterized integral membrane protein (TIGR00698 family)